MGLFLLSELDGDADCCDCAEVGQSLRMRRAVLELGLGWAHTYR